MLKKYSIEYSLRHGRHPASERHTYFTDDPIACEDFVQDLLEHALVLHTIKHDGADLPKHDFDRVVRIAAARVAANRICTTLNIKPEEERYRFGFAA